MCNFLKTTLTVCCLIFTSAKNIINNNYYDPNEFQFICASGESIPREQQCDGVVQCQDSSDETRNCLTFKCPPYLFRCDYGACVETDVKCDGKRDCKDGSDELLSHCEQNLLKKTCGSNQFRCNSGQCIDDTLTCDGIHHCKDKSDEIKSTCWNMKCPAYTFRCNYGACVDGSSPCNGIIDCVDESDENLVVCRVNPQEHRSSCVVSQEFTNSSFPVGTMVEPGTSITVQCYKTKNGMGSAVIAVCKQGLWTYPLGTCSTLPSITINVFLNITINNQSQIEETTTEDDPDRLMFPR